MPPTMLAIRNRTIFRAGPAAHILRPVSNTMQPAAVPTVHANHAARICCADIHNQPPVILDSILVTKVTIGGSFTALFFVKYCLDGRAGPPEGFPARRHV